MPDYNELLKVMKQAAKEQSKAGAPSTVCFGVVVSTAPLQVQVDQRFIIGSDNLIVPQHLTNYSVNVSISGSTAESEGHAHKLGAHVITINNGLKNGDKVVMVSQDGGQKYLIADRVV